MMSWDLQFGSRGSVDSKTTMEDVDKLLKKGADAFKDLIKDQQTALRLIIFQERSKNAGLKNENQRLLAAMEPASTELERTKKDFLDCQAKLNGIQQFLFYKDASTVEPEISRGSEAQPEYGNGKTAIQQSSRKDGQSIDLQVPSVRSPVRLSGRSATAALTASSASEVMLHRRRESIVYRTDFSEGITADHPSNKPSTDFLHGRSPDGRFAPRQQVATKLGYWGKRKCGATAEEEKEAQDENGDVSEKSAEEVDQEPDESASEWVPAARSSSRKTRKRRRTIRTRTDGKMGIVTRSKRARPRVSNSARIVAPGFGISQIDAENRVENGNNDGSVASGVLTEGLQTSLVKLVTFMLPYSGTGKIQCPLDYCHEACFGANDVLRMENHFQRTHKKDFPFVQFILKCSECPAADFGNNIPTLKVHMREHYQYQVQTADDIPVGREEILDSSEGEGDAEQAASAAGIWPWSRG